MTITSSSSGLGGLSGMVAGGSLVVVSAEVVPRIYVEKEGFWWVYVEKECFWWVCWMVVVEVVAVAVVVASELTSSKVTALALCSSCASRLKDKKGVVK